MALQFATQAEIPAGMEDDFTEFDRDGSKVWIPTGEAGALKSQFRLQGDVTALTDSTNSLKTQLGELTTANEQKEKDLADEKERTRTAGLSESEQTKEMITDMQKRLAAQQETFDGQVKQLKAEANQKTVDATVSELATVATPKNQKILQKMIKGDLEIKPDGSVIVLDLDGKATSLTLAEYKDSLAERYPTLTTAVQSEGGEGNGGNGGEVNLGNKKYSELKTAKEKTAALAKKHNRKL